MSGGNAIGTMLTGLLGAGEVGASVYGAQDTPAATAGPPTPGTTPAAGAPGGPAPAPSKFQAALSKASPELMSSGVDTLGKAAASAASGGGDTTPMQLSAPQLQRAAPFQFQGTQAPAMSAVSPTSLGSPGGLSMGGSGTSIQDPQTRALLLQLLQQRGLA